MKYIITILIISLTVCFASTNPNWFYNIKQNKNQIIGYGVATKLDKAKSIAKNEIASAISTKVESYLEIHKKIDNTNSKRKVKQSIKVSTNVVLKDLDIIKSSILSNKWYIAVSYDFTPFAVKFKKLVSNYKINNEKQNQYLAKTNLIKNLNTIIGKKLNYKLYNKNNMWYLGYKQVSMKLSKEDFDRLLAFKNSKIVSLELNKDKYYTNDHILFNIYSKVKGYVSILYIGNNGQVGVIKSNISIDKNIVYPKDNNIILKNQDKYNKKFMVAILYSEQKINLKSFDKISKKKSNNTDFNLLLNYFSKYEYTTYVSNIYKK